MRLFLSLLGFISSRSIQFVVLVAMVIAAIVVLWNLSIFCLYMLRLTLKVVIAASFRNNASFPKCVVLSLTITEIMMIIVTIVRRASGILFVFCLFSWVSNVSAISHPNSGILLAGTAFLPSLVFPSCSSSYSCTVHILPVYFSYVAMVVFYFYLILS